MIELPFVRAGKRAPLRCVLCHDALDGPIGGCARCATAFHLECVEGLEVCPTLGCKAPLHRAEAPNEDTGDGPPSRHALAGVHGCWREMRSGRVGDFLRRLFRARRTNARLADEESRIDRMVTEKPRQLRAFYFWDERGIRLELRGPEAAADSAASMIVHGREEWAFGYFALHAPTLVRVYGERGGPIAVRMPDGRLFAVPSWDVEHR